MTLVNTINTVTTKGLTKLVLKQPVDTAVGGHYQPVNTLVSTVNTLTIKRLTK